MQQLNTLVLAMALLIMLVLLVAYWYAALAVAAVTLVYLAARTITAVRHQITTRR